MIPIILHVSDEQAHRLAQHAREAGYENVEAYLQALVEADLNERTDAVKASIKRGFEDGLSGRTLSESEFWNRLNTDAE
jgi:hypothetical protein